MAITASPYLGFLSDLATGVHDFTTGTYRLVLLTNVYVPDLDVHENFSDISAFEVSTSGTGYTPKDLTGLALVEDTTANTVKVTVSGQVQWTNLIATTRYAVIYTPDTNRLVGLIDFGADRVYNNEPFVLSFPEGIVVVSAS